MNIINAKRILLAAPGSGSGKTTLTCALLEALKNRGLEPVSFKCGPDYIDPLFHKKVLGIEGRNLDSYFAGTEGVQRILSECGNRYAVIEGVMGLYDGITPDAVAGSGYEIAAITDTPVILTVDASGSGRTVLSLIKGILQDDPHRLIKGVILNKISERFYNSLKDVYEKEIGPMRPDTKLLGFFPTLKEIVIKSRHLGLMLPDEIPDLKKKIALSADVLEQNIHMADLLKVMENAPSKSIPEESPHPPITRPGNCDLTLAVAYDDAFCFYYRDNLECFMKRGVKIRYFSPLKDSALPKGTTGILLGGGYPENHLSALSQNGSMLSSIRDAIQSGIPSLAECGGFMYLHDSITDADEKRYEMAGVIKGNCFCTGHLVRFGYMYIDNVNAPFSTDELFASLRGMKGHEFHYYDSSSDANACVAKKPFRDGERNCMILQNNGIWGFPHLYYASDPDFVDCFIQKMKDVFSLA